VEVRAEGSRKSHSWARFENVVDSGESQLSKKGGVEELPEKQGGEGGKKGNCSLTLREKKEVVALIPRCRQKKTEEGKRFSRKGSHRK